MIVAVCDDTTLHCQFLADYLTKQETLNARIMEKTTVSVYFFLVLLSFLY